MFPKSCLQKTEFKFEESRFYNRGDDKIITELQKY